MTGSSLVGGFEWVVGLLLLAWGLTAVVRVVRWVWWTPRRLERVLREQGIAGNPYRILVGDTKEEVRLLKEAMLKPMPSSSSHDIAARVAPLLHRTMKTHGKMCFNWSGPSPRMNIMDPVLIREILSNKPGDLGPVRPHPIIMLIVSGLVTYDGEKWAMHRKIINPAFHAEKLKCMMPAFSACCSELMSRWEKMLGPDGSCEVDVWPDLRNFTRDVISRTAFGSSFEDGRRICQLQEEQTEHILQSAQYLSVPGYRYLPTKRNRRMREIAREVRGLLRDMVMEREKAMQSGTASNDNLLGLLLESNQAYSQESGNSNKFRMTIEEVIEECKLFYFAGQETTSDLLTWAMVVLSMHQSWQARARAEVLQVFGKDKLDFDGLSQLKIVTMILHEVLRLYPPAMFMARSVNRTTKLGQYTFPPGVQLLLPILFMHHDPELWGEDAKEFKPERFAVGVAKASKNQMSFFPFGGGPRICIGQNFAMMEAKMGLATILQHFSFDLSPAYTHAPCSTLTLQPQHGAQVVLHKL